MNDSEFLELLNLYVDHEISADGAARLEAEVTANAERRRVYRQYCMIHKGCSLLTGAAAEQAPAAVRRGRVVDREARSFWGWSGAFAAGGLAAAAAFVAFLTMHRPSAQSAGTVQVASAAPAAPLLAQPTAATAPSAPAPSDLSVAMAAPRQSSFPSPFGGGQLQTAFNTRAWSNPVAAAGSMGARDPLAWIDQVKLTPVSHPGMLIPIEIKDSAVLLPLDASTAPLNLGPSEPTDVTAFEIQRK